jgi:sortase A
MTNKPAHPRGARLRRLERAAWVAGVVLLMVGAGRVASDESGRREAIARFEAARAIPTVSVVAAVAPTTAPAPAAEAPPRLTAEADQGSPAADLPLAVLRIPAVGLEVPVLADVSPASLARGAGWVAGTARPGSAGNVAIAAHRDSHFAPLAKLVRGDRLELELPDGRRTHFRVSTTRVVDPEDVSVLAPTPGDAITLITCFPFRWVGPAPQRYIVHALPATD